MPQSTLFGRILDQLFDGFVAELPRKLRGPARDLPRRLGLTPRANMPWSEVFHCPAAPLSGGFGQHTRISQRVAELELQIHETGARSSERRELARQRDSGLLGFPLLLLGETDRAMSQESIRAAGLAHLLAVIGSMGVERLDDGQVPLTSVTAELIGRVQRARNVALNQLAQGPSPVTWHWAQRQVWSSVIGARAVFRGNESATLDAYRAISLMKQGLAFPASLAAAKAEGWSESDQQCARQLIAGAYLGLQYRADVVTWREDHALGQCWPVALLESDTVEIPVEGRLAASGILVQLLNMSRDAFERAHLAAAQLGAIHLSQWTAQQASTTDGLARLEAHEPGAAVRWELARRQRMARQPVMPEAARAS